MWGLLSFLVGIVYGWAVPGRQDKAALIRTGVLIGLVLAIVFSVVGFALNSSPIGVGVGIVGIVIDIVIITLLFALGVWIGDLIEGAGSRRREPRV